MLPGVERIVIAIGSVALAAGALACGLMIWLLSVGHSPDGLWASASLSMSIATVLLSVTAVLLLPAAPSADHPPPILRRARTGPAGGGKAFADLVATLPAERRARS